MKTLTWIGLASLLLVSRTATAQESVMAPGAAVTTTTTITAPSGEPVITSLKDGTKLEVFPDGTVYVVYTDGSKVTAPDGIHTLNDGTTLVVKNGLRQQSEPVTVTTPTLVTQ